MNEEELPPISLDTAVKIKYLHLAASAIEQKGGEKWRELINAFLDKITEEANRLGDLEGFIKTWTARN